MKRGFCCDSIQKTSHKTGTDAYKKEAYTLSVSLSSLMSYCIRFIPYANYASSGYTETCFLSLPLRS